MLELVAVLGIVHMLLSAGLEFMSHRVMEASNKIPEKNLGQAICSKVWFPPRVHKTGAYELWGWRLSFKVDSRCCRHGNVVYLPKTTRHQVKAFQERGHSGEVRLPKLVGDQSWYHVVQVLAMEPLGLTFGPLALSLALVLSLTLFSHYSLSECLFCVTVGLK